MYRVDYDYFKKYVRSKGLSLTKTAENAGVSQKTVLRMTCGLVSEKTARKILGYFGSNSHREVFGVDEELIITWEYVYKAEDAEKVANAFHDALCGNDDYRDNRIILNWSGDTVTLTIFSDAKTSVTVTQSQGDAPSISWRYEDDHEG